MAGQCWLCITHMHCEDSCAGSLYEFGHSRGLGDFGHLSVPGLQPVYGQRSHRRDGVSCLMWILRGVHSNKEFLHGDISPGTQSLRLIALPLKPGPRVILAAIVAGVGTLLAFSRNSTATE